MPFSFLPQPSRCGTQVKSLRGVGMALAAGSEVFWMYSMLVFHTYWSGAGDISQDDVLSGIATEAVNDPLRFSIESCCF